MKNKDNLIDNLRYAIENEQWETAADLAKKLYMLKEEYGYLTDTGFGNYHDLIKYSTNGDLKKIKEIMENSSSSFPFCSVSGCKWAGVTWSLLWATRYKQFEVSQYLLNKFINSKK